MPLNKEGLYHTSKVPSSYTGFIDKQTYHQQNILRSKHINVFTCYKLRGSLLKKENFPIH